MREEPLRQLLAKLGITKLDKRNSTKGLWLNAMCPLAPWTHKKGSDRRPSFGVVVNDEGTSIFSCLACEQKGSTTKLIRLLQHHRGIDYTELFALAEEGDKGVRRYRPFDEDIVAEAEELVPLNEAMWDGLFDPIRDHREAVHFLANRRVRGKAADKLGLSFDAEKRRVVFPVRHTDGQLYGFSGRTVIPGHEPKVLDYGGLPKRNLILGSDRWRPGYPKLIVEGLIAFGRMHEIGVEEFADIGALLGSEMTPEKAAILIAAGDLVVLLLDPDEAGVAGVFGVWDSIVERFDIATGALAKLYGHVPVVVPEFPMDACLDRNMEPDVDNLELSEVRAMLAEPMWRPDADQKRALQAAGKGLGGPNGRRREANTASMAERIADRIAGRTGKGRIAPR